MNLAKINTESKIAKFFVSGNDDAIKVFNKKKNSAMTDNRADPVCRNTGTGPQLTPLPLPETGVQAESHAPVRK